MADYDFFARHYDVLMGDGRQNAAIVKQYLKKHGVKGGRVLELACGTGSVLSHFSGQYEVSGLDLSRAMLKEARKKIPQGSFFRADMPSFRLRKKFDVIYCVYDSINHLLRFSDWQKVFRRSYEHLSEGGLFIFDMNTEYALFEAASRPVDIRKFGKRTLSIDISHAENGSAHWNIRFTETGKKATKLLYEENIREISFSPERVKKALSGFRKVEVYDRERKRPSVRSSRLYFICKK